MTRFDDFFRANYLRMVRYVAHYHPHFRRQDAEEVVSDVIHKHYDEYLARIDGPSPDSVLRRWLIRRSVFNMLDRYALYEYRMSEPLPEDYEALSFDDPADIVDLRQRIPQVPRILVEYETYVGRPVDRKLTHRYSRAKKKFLNQLER